jgi:hypothetical protein
MRPSKWWWQRSFAEPMPSAASSIEWQQWGGLCREYAAQSATEAHGSPSAKNAKSVLHGVIGYAVDNGLLSRDATRQVGTVTSKVAKSKGARPHSSDNTQVHAVDGSHRIPKRQLVRRSHRFV